jgi:hypothetical protein
MPRLIFFAHGPPARRSQSQVLWRQQVKLISPLIASNVSSRTSPGSLSSPNLTAVAQSIKMFVIPNLILKMPLNALLTLKAGLDQIGRSAALWGRR